MVVSCVLSLRLESQVMPLEFVCIKDDTLFWNPTINMCGPFQSVDIYKSSDRSGPFALLTSVTDPTATWFVDNAASTAYYYLESNHDCTGQNVIASDTFSNQFQQFVTKIESVTVAGDDVEITWNDNGSPQTIGYIVYRITSQGTLPIDTIFNGFTYLDVSASPNDRVESYYVLGLNACGGTNTFDALPHSTILLSTEVDFCSQHIKLTWNGYEAWENGIEHNQIWLGLDGDPLAFEHQISGTDTLAYITGIMDDTEYCISIMAKEDGRNVTSASNVVCLVSDVLAPLNQLEILNVSVGADENVVLDWSSNSDADVMKISVQRGDDSANLVPLQDFSLPITMDQNQFLDSEASPESQPFTYRLSAIDDCDTMQLSNYMSTVHLRLLAAEEGENQIAWSPFQLSGRVLVNYVPCRIENGMDIQLGETTPPHELFFTDQVPIDQRDEQICYVIKALHTYPDGTDPRISRSNVLCVEQDIALYIPNAFVPRGINNIFIPKFLNQPQSGYQMSIFDRWGGMVFETFDPNHGWDGNHNGNRCAAGVYMYLIQFPQPDGGKEIFGGELHLIR